MLDADRQALSASVYHSALNIKERELVNLTNYLNNLGTMAALMFGFGVAWFVEVPSGTHIAVQYIYYAMATICVAAEMYCLANATLCTVLGPTLALNGPRGAMHAAVFGMYEERYWIWCSFAVGAVCFSINLLVYIWMILASENNAYDNGIAAVCTVIFVAGGTLVTTGVRRVFNRFAFEGQGSVSTPQSNATDPAAHVSAVEFLKTQTAASMINTQGTGTGKKKKSIEISMMKS